LPLSLLPLLATAHAQDPAPQPAAEPAEEPAVGDELVVTAARTEQARADATAAVRVIGRAEIAASGARSVDELLRTVPGVELAQSHGGVGVRLQGLEPRHTLILVDGRPVDGRVDGTVDLSRLRLDEVARVEVVRGPASALYGSDALGGVINIVTRQHKAPWHAEAAARYGTWQATEARASVAAARGPWRAQVRGALWGSDGYDLDPTTDATTADAEDSFEAGFDARYQPGGGAMELNGNYQQRRFVGVDASATGAVFDRTLLEESATASVSGALRPEALQLARLELAPSLWRQQYLSDQRGSDVQDTWSETRDGRLRLLGTYRAVVGAQHRHLLVAGVDGELGWMASERLAHGAAARQRGAFYAQDDWRVWDRPRLVVAPGARLDLDSQFGLHPTPRLAVRLDPGEAVAVRASAGMGYRAPDFKELHLWFDHSGYGYVVAGNPDLRPETSLGFTADLDWKVTRWLSLSLGGWHTDATDLIEVALAAEGDGDAAARYQYKNVASARTRGGDAGLHLVVGGVSAELAYTFTDARDRADDTPLDGRAPHRGTLALGFAPPRWPISGSVRAELVGPRPWGDGAGGVTWSNPSLWLDARLAAQVGQGLSLEVGVRNALDVRNDPLGSPPRSFYAGLRAEAGPPSLPPSPRGQP
jgi:outer membrane receptor for ferrienterochelin and colicins